MLEPVVAVSFDAPPVCGLVLHCAPVHTPRLRPTICDVFGASPVIETVTEPSVVMVKMCWNAPLTDSVPVKMSVCGFGAVVLAAASCESVLSEHADVAAAASVTAATTPAVLSDTIMRTSRDMVCFP